MSNFPMTTQELRQQAYVVSTVTRAIGGSFMSHLGEALAFADGHNQRKIMETWPNEWQDYYQAGQHALSVHANLTNHELCEWCTYLAIIDKSDSRTLQEQYGN